MLLQTSGEKYDASVQQTHQGPQHCIAIMSWRHGSAVKEYSTVRTSSITSFQKTHYNLIRKLHNRCIAERSEKAKFLSNRFTFKPSKNDYRKRKTSIESEKWGLAPDITFAFTSSIYKGNKNQLDLPLVKILLWAFSIIRYSGT